MAGSVFGRQGDSGSDGDDETQLKFYTEQHRGRRRSRGETREVVCEFVCAHACVEHGDVPNLLLSLKCPA